MLLMSATRRWRRVRRWLRSRSVRLVVATGGLAVVALGVAVVAGGDGPSGAGEQTTASEAGSLDAEPAEAGEALPDLTFETLDGGQARSLRTLAIQGQGGLVVNFFASWCRPCLEELPQFQAVYADHRDEVAFVGLNLQDTRAAGRRLVDRFGLAYPIGVDPNGQLFTALGGYAMPTTVFVRDDGTIAEIHAGELSGEALRARLREHQLLG